MKNLLRLILLALLIAVGFWVWNILFPNPQKIIRHRLNKLAQLASFAPNEGNFSRIASGTLGTEERMTRKTISLLLRCMEGVLAEWRLKPTPANAAWLEDVYVTMCMGALEALAAQPV